MRKTYVRSYSTPILISFLALGLSQCNGTVSSPEVSVTQVQPAVVCGTQAPKSVAISGDGFAPLPIDTLISATGLELPKVVLSQRMLADGSSGTAPELQVYDGADQNHVRWQGAGQMSFDVYPGMRVSDPATGAAGSDLEFGLYDVSVQNPDGRRGVLASALAVVPPPRLISAVPNPACTAQGDVAYTLTGSNFIQINSQLPQVRFTDISTQQVAQTLTATSASGCTGLPSPVGTTLQSCTSLVVTVPKDGLAAGSTYRLAVLNADATGCASQEDVRTVVIPPPTITSMTTLAVCSQAATTLQIVGTGFVHLTQPSDQTPVLTISGKTFPTQVSDCTPIVDAPGAELCTTLMFTVPQGSFTIGTYTAQLQNPAGGCQVAASLKIDVVGPPTLTNVAPTSLCSGGGTLTLTGTNIYSGAVALIDTFESSSLTTDGTTAMAAFSGPLTVNNMPGQPRYNVTLRNAPGCEATLSMIEVVTPGPSILFVDPPVVPNIITIQATVYASSVSPPIQRVRIAPTGTQNYTSFTTALGNLTLDPARPNRALITLNKGLATGSYDVLLDDQSICSAYLVKGFSVVATPTLTVTAMTPPFGAQDQNTAVVIDGAGFKSTPRVYLTPTGSPVGSLAQALAGVTFQSATRLTAVVQAGLTPGSYDLVVVNPDGSFGVKSQAFTVTSSTAPPPVITSIAPSSVVTATSSPVTIQGTGFRAGASVKLTCYDATGTVVAGSSATVTAVSATTVSATVIGTGIYCIVRVTNQDGTYFDYSAIGVTNASLNLTGFKAGANLIVGRRAMAAVAGRPTAVTRFVYAIGGDRGADNTPQASVESAQSGLDGQLLPFFTQAQSLPKALSFLSVVNIGRFLYAVGGFDGTAAVKDVYRAELLSPLLTPQFSDVDFTYNRNLGLAPGAYNYRISAVLSGTDPNNPSGETLTGDVFPLLVPAVANEGGGLIQVTLYWKQFTNAQRYRIYRSPKVNDPAGQERLLAEVTDTGMMLQSFVDQGTTTPAGLAPLPIGSTGSWRQLTTAPLQTARLGAGVAAAQDPTDPTKWYLYAAGGNSGTPSTPSALRSVEFLPIVIAGGGNTQTFATWTSATSQMSSGRWLVGGLAATQANNSLITPAGATYLYVASGSTSSITNLDGNIDVAMVQAGGQLAAFSNAGSTGLKRPGYGSTMVNNQLMGFGGFGGAGTASNNSDTATLKTATTLNNFNALGNGALTQPRALQGTAIESAFIYQLGGANAGVNTAQVSTEQAIW